MNLKGIQNVLKKYDTPEQLFSNKGLTLRHIGQGMTRDVYRIQENRRYVLKIAVNLYERKCNVMEQTVFSGSRSHLHPKSHGVFLNNHAILVDNIPNCKRKSSAASDFILDIVKKAGVVPETYEEEDVQDEFIYESVDDALLYMADSDYYDPIEGVVELLPSILNIKELVAFCKDKGLVDFHLGNLVLDNHKGTPILRLIDGGQ